MARRPVRWADIFCMRDRLRSAARVRMSGSRWQRRFRQSWRITWLRSPSESFFGAGRTDPLRREIEVQIHRPTPAAGSHLHRSFYTLETPRLQIHSSRPLNPVAAAIDMDLLFAA